MQITGHFISPQISRSMHITCICVKCDTQACIERNQLNQSMALTHNGAKNSQKKGFKRNYSEAGFCSHLERVFLAKNNRTFA